MSWRCISCSCMGSKKSLSDHIRKDHLQLAPAHTNYNGLEDKPCGMGDVRVDDFMRRRRTNACTQTKRFKKESTPTDRQRRVDEATLKYHFFMRDPYLASGVHTPYALSQWQSLTRAAEERMTERERNLFPAPIKISEERDMSLAQQVLYRSAKQASQVYEEDPTQYDSAVRTNREYLYK